MNLSRSLTHEVRYTANHVHGDVLDLDIVHIYVDLPASCGSMVCDWPLVCGVNVFGGPLMLHNSKDCHSLASDKVLQSYKQCEGM